MFYEHGAQEPQVEEHHSGLNSALFRAELLFQSEFEVVAEPKALLPADLRYLIKKYGSHGAAAGEIEVSESFVRQNSVKSKHKHRRKQR